MKDETAVKQMLAIHSALVPVETGSRWIDESRLAERQGFIKALAWVLAPETQSSGPLTDPAEAK